MKRFILIPKKIEGYLVYSFNRLGYLQEWVNCTYGMTEDQVRATLNALGYCLDSSSFVEWARQNDYEVRTVPIDLSFERFYAEFDMSRNKLDARKLWDKLKTNEDRLHAIYAHHAYQQYCRDNPWYTKMYPDTFLRNNLHDEWYKIKPKTNDKNLTR